MAIGEYLEVWALFLTIIFWIALITPTIAVSVRRLHDISKSGWWYLILFAPLVGEIAWFVFMCIDGDQGSNRFGGNPKAAVQKS